MANRIVDSRPRRSDTLVRKGSRRSGGGLCTSSRTSLLGYLDDLLIVPLGMLVVRLVPASLMVEFRAEAEGGRKTG